MSLITTSGASFPNAASASSHASNARTRTPQRSSSVVTSSRESASSSTSMTRVPARRRCAPATACSEYAPGSPSPTGSGYAPGSGSVTTNRAPCPTSRFMAATAPPCISTSWLTMASPSPRPAWRRAEASRCRKRSNTCGRKSGSIPGPSSTTSIRAEVPSLASEISTRPPSAANLIAFESRFQATCCNRSGSPSTGGTRASRFAATSTRLASAAGRIVSMAPATTCARSTGCFFSSSWPTDIREMSRMSEMR